MQKKNQMKNGILLHVPYTSGLEKSITKSDSVKAFFFKLANVIELSLSTIKPLL